MPASDGPLAAARIAGVTHVAGVIGWPVEHSLSPQIHNAAFAALGLDWTYVPLPVVPGAMRAATDGLVALGFRGANVTMPHKTEAADLADDLSDDASRLRAVNTFVVRGDRLSGHNTDVSGFERFLVRDIGFEPQGRSALVYGAGGAARAVALALAQAGMSSLTVAVRDPSRASDVSASADGTATAVRVVSFADVADLRVDLVVNATPLGADGRGCPPLGAIGPGVLVVDLLYRPAQTPLQLQARAAGAEAFGGLGLLLHQAALSFELWTGTPAPLDVMSAAALGVLADPR
ncbi:MAG TPA: shikimate dehydrogenase [Actinomycetota bacterium]